MGIYVCMWDISTHITHMYAYICMYTYMCIYAISMYKFRYAYQQIYMSLYIGRELHMYIYSHIISMLAKITCACIYMYIYINIFLTDRHGHLCVCMYKNTHNTHTYVVMDEHTYVSIYVMDVYI